MAFYFACTCFFGGFGLLSGLSEHNADNDIPNVYRFFYIGAYIDVYILAAILGQISRF